MDARIPHEFQTLHTKTQQFLVHHQPVAELVIMLVLYAGVQNSAVRYLRSAKRAKAAGYIYNYLLVHIVTSFIIASRYYILQLFGLPMPNSLDLVLGLIQTITSLCLAKYTPAHDTLYKSSFQAMGVMNLVSVVATFATGSPKCHRIFVKCVDWFTYFRWLLIAMRKTHVLGFPKLPVTVSVHLVSAPFTLWMAGYPGGIPIYFALLIAVMSLNRRVSRLVPHR